MRGHETLPCVGVLWIVSEKDDEQHFAFLPTVRVLRVSHSRSEKHRRCSTDDHISPSHDFASLRKTDFAGVLVTKFSVRARRKKLSSLPITSAKMQGMRWDDLRYVLQVARGGTLAAAARRLGVNQTTVSRRLAAVEAALETRLFARSDGTLFPTKAGEIAIGHATKVELEFDAVERGVGGFDAIPVGVVRVTAVPILVNHLLVPALPRFYKAYPQIKLELIAESHNLNLTHREADIALRLARPDKGKFLARRIGHLDYAVFGPRKRASNDIPWISYEEGTSHVPQARWIAAQSSVPAALLVNDAEAILRAVRAGLGKSLLPYPIARLDAKLEALSGSVLSREIWLLVHRELRSQARIKVVISWLQDVAKTCRARP